MRNTAKKGLLMPTLVTAIYNCGHSPGGSVQCFLFFNRYISPTGCIPPFRECFNGSPYVENLHRKYRSVTAYCITQSIPWKRCLRFPSSSFDLRAPPRSSFFFLFAIRSRKRRERRHAPCLKGGCGLSRTPWKRDTEPTKSLLVA